MSGRDWKYEDHGGRRDAHLFVTKSCGPFSMYPDCVLPRGQSRAARSHLRPAQYYLHSSGQNDVRPSSWADSTVGREEVSQRDVRNLDDPSRVKEGVSGAIVPCKTTHVVWSELLQPKMTLMMQ